MDGGTSAVKAECSKSSRSGKSKSQQKPKTASRAGSFRLIFAKLDHEHCLAHGLFRTTTKRKAGEAEAGYQIVREFGEKNTSEYRKIEFVVPKPLRTLDMLVLQCLSAVGGMTPDSFEDKIEFDDNDTAKHLIQSSKRQIVEISISSLLHELDRSSGSENYDAIKDSIDRLGSVVINVEVGTRKRNFLLLEYDLDTAVSENYISANLNPVLTYAIHKNNKNRYVRIDLSEVRQLSGERAPLVYQRLCGYINQGGACNVSLNTICSYIWPEVSDSQKPSYVQRSHAKAVIEQLIGIGWSVTNYAKDKYRFYRPALDT